VEQISSRQNTLVKRLRLLANDRGTDDEVLLDGAHLVEEALASDVELRLVLVATDAMDGPLGALAARAASRGARTIALSPHVAEAVSPVRSPTGIIAVAALQPRPLDWILQRTPPLLLVLDHVQDPGNVGAIVRAAEGCGATGVVAGPGTADPFGWKALRGSMGSAFRVPIARADSLAEAVTVARRAGVRVFATGPRGGTPLHETKLAGPAAFVLGGEGAGLSQAIVDLTDEGITIPMRGRVESLNVSVAAALMLYEAFRQRQHVPLR
jgi:TrmH family RNA methyltransferase